MEVTPIPGDTDEHILLDNGKKMIQNSIWIKKIKRIKLIMPMMKLEDGIKAHKMGDREIAFECFKRHAEIDNKVAKYWIGYYYKEGYVVEKNIGKAIELFKEAADKGVPDAQLRYAFALIGNNFNIEEFVKYLIMAADNGNAIAQFNAGDLYYNGKLRTPKDEEKGLELFKIGSH
jgi:TPR repeat protein